MIRFNKSRVLQVVQLDGRSVNLPPRWAIDAPKEVGNIAADIVDIGTVESPREMFDGRSDMTFGIARRGGLGDVIMLLPVIRVLMELYPKMRVNFYTTHRHAQFLEHTQTERLRIIDESRIRRGGVDFGMSMEGVVERDHDLPGTKYTTMPRHQIYAEALGVLKEVKKIEHQQDFSIEVTEADRKKVLAWTRGINRPMALLQVRGNAPTRCLPFDRMVAITEHLVKMGFAVLPSDYVFFSKLKGDHVYQFHGATLRQVLEIMRQCKFVITMESGLLHMAHVANAPTICFYGPTRIQERGAFHPSYDKGWVVPIQLDKEVGCEPCFVTTIKCKGAIPCMRAIPAARLVEMVEAAVQKMLFTLDHKPR